VEEGSLYPALERMLIAGLITAKWGATAANHRGAVLPPDSCGTQAVGNGGVPIRTRHGGDSAYRATGGRSVITSLEFDRIRSHVPNR